METNLYDKRIHTTEFIDMYFLVTKLNEAVERFSKGGWVLQVEYPSCWRKICAVLKASPARYQSAKAGDFKVNAGTLAGRIMVTLSKGESQITVIGDEGRPSRGCGLQSIDASAKEAIEIIDTAIVSWSALNFAPNKNVAIA